MTQREFMLKTTMDCNDDGTHCYSITREFVGKEGNSAILLTLYPSYSVNDSFRLDSTAFHFLGHMEELALGDHRLAKCPTFWTRVTCRRKRLDKGETSMEII